MRFNSCTRSASAADSVPLAMSKKLTASSVVSDALEEGAVIGWMWVELKKETSRPIPFNSTKALHGITKRGILLRVDPFLPLSFINRHPQFRQPDE
jgi:hypothetical protein